MCLYKLNRLIFTQWRESQKPSGQKVAPQTQKCLKTKILRVYLQFKTILVCTGIELNFLMESKRFKVACLVDCDTLIRYNDPRQSSHSLTRHVKDTVHRVLHALSKNRGQLQWAYRIYPPITGNNESSQKLRSNFKDYCKNSLQHFDQALAASFNSWSGISARSNVPSKLKDRDDFAKAHLSEAGTGFLWGDPVIFSPIKKRCRRSLTTDDDHHSDVRNFILYFSCAPTRQSDLETFSPGFDTDSEQELLATFMPKNLQEVYKSQSLKLRWIDCNISHWQTQVINFYMDSITCHVYSSL